MRGRTLVIILAIIFFYIAGIWAYFYFDNDDNRKEGEIILTKTYQPLSDESYAKIPNGFPLNYIWGTDIVIIDGGIDDSIPDETRYWVIIDTADSPESLIGQYREFFQAIPWTIKEVVSFENDISISAQFLDQQLDVSASKKSGGGSNVQIIYTGPPFIIESP